MAFASLLRSGFVGIVAAVGAVVITFFIADVVSGPLLASQPGADGPQEVPLGGAVVGTVIAGVVAIVLAYITSRMKRSTAIFLLICVVGLVLYGLFAWSAADSQSTGIWLNVMHIAAAVPIVGQLTRWVSGQPTVVKAASAVTAGTSPEVTTPDSAPTDSASSDDSSTN